jgi:hypothetical protein
MPPGSPEAIQDHNIRSYRLLAPFPGLSELLDPDLCAELRSENKLKDGQICDVNEFLNYILKILIAITAVFLIVKIIMVGIKYMITDIANVKASAKSELMGAVTGLLIALTSYLILNTINPKLVNNSVGLGSVEVGVMEEFLEGEGFSTISGKTIKITKSKVTYAKQYSNVDACAGRGGTNSNPNLSTCVNYSLDIARSAQGKYVEKEFAQKLLTFQQTLKVKNIPWKISEAWPASRVHKAVCHQIGVCIDMNHTSGWGKTDSNQNPSVQQVKTVIETAANLGMCAQYEILNNSSLNNQLVAAGLGKNVIYFNGKWISANHYSLYNGTCK